MSDSLHRGGATSAVSGELRQNGERHPERRKDTEGSPCESLKGPWAGKWTNAIPSRRKDHD